ncbi:unnamed protein product, partial [Prorocentrum cordatum]
MPGPRACLGGCGLLVHSEAAGPGGREYAKFGGWCCLRCKDSGGQGDHGKKCEQRQAPANTPKFGEEDLPPRESQNVCESPYFPPILLISIAPFGSDAGTRTQRVKRTTTIILITST